MPWSPLKKPMRWPWRRGKKMLPQELNSCWNCTNPAGLTIKKPKLLREGQTRQLRTFMNEPTRKNDLKLLSVVIPARDEEGCIASTVEHLHLELNLQRVPHEIVVVNDGSADSTWKILCDLARKIPELAPVQNSGAHGFGRAIIRGLNAMKGDAVVIMMADESDDCRDVVRYWKLLNEGWDCVFGSRFIKGGGTIDYPPVKHVVNRLANFFIKVLFHIPLNDTTNAFKAYRREAIDGCRPLIAPHFNLTVELPLRAVVR